MRSVPPGRAGRLWLLDKLAGARRSSDLLEQKRQVLLREYARVSTLADASRVEWENACREAERWALRLALLGGQRELNVLATGRAGRAELEVVWKSSMGLDQPEEGRCVLPVAQRLLDVSGNAAGAPAVEAYRQALDAAVTHAVAEEAKRRLANELVSTRRRLRSITHRRLPDLEGRLNDLELRLDAAELEDHVVGRWAREQLRASARQGST